MPVTVPAALNFQWSNPRDLPDELPQISFRPPRNETKYHAIAAPVPAYEMLIRRPPARPGKQRIRDEFNRRRHDAKPDFGFNRIYSLMHRALDNPSEYLDFLNTVDNNFQGGPTAIATALAFNEYIDYKYGIRARLLRKHIYQNPRRWQLPVGYDTISRIWR